MDFIDRLVSILPCNSMSVRENIKKVLRNHINILINMDDIHLARLANHIISSMIISPKHIGMHYAQMLLHGITQSSLSGKVSNLIFYLPIMDILEMKSSHSFCKISGDHGKLLELEHVTIKDIITGIEPRDRPFWLSYGYDTLSIDSISEAGVSIVLNKNIMSKHGITMSTIARCIKDQCQDLRELKYSPNYLAEIYISNYHYGSVINIINTIDVVTLSGITGFKIFRHDSTSSYCHHKYLAELHKKGFNVECNDIMTVYDVLGYDSCKNLIIKSLAINDGISEQCAKVICNYMMRTGKPMPFTKNTIKGLYGPMFDMYYGKPAATISEWIIEENNDNCTNIYTRLMIGSKNIL